MVINFHGLGPLPSHVESGEAKVWCTDPALYADLLDEAQDEARAAGLECLITFDDGNLSDLQIGARLLADRGMRAIFFPCAGRIGRSGYLDQGGLRELVALGMDIGSHGWSHIDWRRASPTTMRQEISEARDRIEQAAGAAVATVAIPFGSYNRRVLRDAASFEIVFTSDATIAERGARLQPRFSFTRDWARGTIARLITDSRRPTRRMRQKLAMTVKRLR